MIAIIDYGRGNLGSVEKAFARLGVPATVTQDPRAVDDARAVVLPGDGAFHDAMANLQTLGLLAPLRRALDGTRPFLGICLGYQLLFTSSEEFGEGRGLDVIPGVVRRWRGASTACASPPPSSWGASTPRSSTRRRASAGGYGSSRTSRRS